MISDCNNNNNNNNNKDEKQKISLEYQQNEVWIKLSLHLKKKFNSLNKRGNSIKISKALNHWFLNINQDNWKYDPLLPHLPLQQQREHEANQVLQSVLRGYFPDEKYAFVIDNIVDILWNEIDHLKNTLCTKHPDAPTIQWSEENPSIIKIGSKSYKSARLTQIMKKFGDRVDHFIIARLLLIYNNGLSFNRSHNLMENPKVTDILYNQFNVRFEAFASILDTVFFDKDDAKWCSLFYDVERHFGSMGNFFSLDLSREELQGSWHVHPPFVESIINDLAMKILHSLKFDGIESCFYLTLPSWNDLFGIQQLRQSRFCLAALDDVDIIMFAGNSNKIITNSRAKLVFIVVGHPSFNNIDVDLLKKIHGK